MPLWSPVSSLLFYLLLLILLAAHVTVCTSAESSCYFCSLPWLAAGGVMALISALLSAVLAALTKPVVDSRHLRTVGQVPAQADLPLLRHWSSPGVCQAQHWCVQGKGPCSQVCGEALRPVPFRHAAQCCRLTGLASYGERQGPCDSHGGRQSCWSQVGGQLADREKARTSVPSRSRVRHSGRPWTAFLFSRRTFSFRSLRAFGL